VEIDALEEKKKKEDLGSPKLASADTVSSSSSSNSSSSFSAPGIQAQTEKDRESKSKVQTSSGGVLGATITTTTTIAITNDRRGMITALSELTDRSKTGSICVRVNTASDLLTSKSGWKYRRMSVEDQSMNAELLIAETKFEEWKFRTGDHIVCRVRSDGINIRGRLVLFYDDFLGPLEAAEALFKMAQELHELTVRSSEHMKPSETVYQISAREIRSLLQLIKLWISEGKPQHYTKWCQMHQIVATNLYYMGLVKRTGSMSGYYYPTEEALQFFEGRRKLSKKKVFTRGKDGRHVPASDEGEERTFAEYLNDYSDREAALREYQEALLSYREKLQSGS
jgi:hypothetical protein